MPHENKEIKIKLKSYDSKLIDSSAVKIVEVVKSTGADIIGPVPLPTRREVFTILRAVHKYKDSREQFEMRVHRRMVEIQNSNQTMMKSLAAVNLPSGVGVEIKQA